MKILISVSYYAPHISGLTNSIKNLAEGLAKKGNTVDVLTTQHSKDLPLTQIVNKVVIHRVPYLLKLQKGFIMPFYLLFLIKHIWKTDCVLINLPQAEGVFTAVVGRLLGKRVVSVYACEIALPKSLFASLIEKVLTFSHFVTLHMSDEIVALSDDYAHHAKLLRSFAHKTVGIYPFITKPIIHNGEKIKSEKKYTIGFLGRISAEKGIEYLLGAIPSLSKQLGNDFIILLAGPKAVGELKYVEKIESLAEKYKEHVSFVSTLADEEMGAFYASLDVLVLPSINSTEAFGMVQVEAMFCGTPVVCSDLPGVRVPILETGMGEIAKKKDSEDLAQKIIAIVKNKQDYQKKKKIVEEVFDSEKVLEAFEKVLTSQPR